MHYRVWDMTCILEAFRRSRNASEERCQLWVDIGISMCSSGMMDISVKSCEHHRGSCCSLLLSRPSPIHNLDQQTLTGYRYHAINYKIPL
jgi:hypothetical protein